MPARGALLNVRTAVPPRQPLQLPPDLHLTGVQVGEFPAQAQCLTLPEAARQPDRPPRGVPAPFDGREHGAGLLGLSAVFLACPARGASTSLHGLRATLPRFTSISYALDRTAWILRTDPAESPSPSIAA